MSQEIDQESEPEGKPDDPRVLSKKIEVVEALFFTLCPSGRPDWETPLIATNDHVTAAIRERNRLHPNTKKLSDKNAANFLKDFIRKRTCNTNWPQTLKVRKITARQRYGKQQVMEFVPFGVDDTVPFPDRFDPIPNMPTFPFEALSIPIEARQLGRKDEPWLIQVVVSQRILNTHLAIVSRGNGLVVETLAHLQTSVKTQPEIDATFVASVVGEPRDGRAVKARTYITCEAKQYGERILEYQIREQVSIAFKLTSSLIGEEAIDAIIPVVFQVVDHQVSRNLGSNETVRGIYLAQFQMINRASFEANFGEDRLHELPLIIQSRAFYEPYPPVRGISRSIKSHTLLTKRPRLRTQST